MIKEIDGLREKLDHFTKTHMQLLIHTNQWKLFEPLMVTLHAMKDIKMKDKRKTSYDS